MVDNEKRDNLVNARRKLKKFRDQQQPTNDNHSTVNNGIDVPSINGTSNESTINYNNIPQNLTGFVNEQQTTLNGNHQNLSKSPVTELEEQNRQYALLIENQKQQRSRLDNQRQSGAGSSMSGRSSQNHSDIDSTRHIEQKYRRDVEHLQEQLEIHVQTIGILVAEKTDVSAKLSQSFKQLERKQSEMDELHGRLKASRERVQELEKQMQNSTSNVQKREMVAKESDKENDRLKIENIRQSQLVEDLKQNINELNEKFHNRQTMIDQLNSEIEQLKKQSQPINDTSVIDKYEQQINELQQTVVLKNNQIDELVSSINQVRSDNEEMQKQYQQYNINMQQHCQELNNQITQLQNENEIRYSEVRHDHTTENTLFVDRDSLEQENHRFRDAIDQWSNRYEEIRIEKEQMAKLLVEKDKHITELEANTNQLPVPSNDNNQLTELQERFTKMSNENIHLTKQIESMEYLNKQLNERHEQKQSDTDIHKPENTTTEQHSTVNDSNSSDENDSQQKLIERFNRAMHENADLKDRTQHLEHVILQLQSETETIGDYIYLYQQQREQLQRRYQEKDDYIKQLTQDRLNLQKKLSELEILLIHSLHRTPQQESIDQSSLLNQQQLNTTEKERSETVDSELTTTDQTMPLNSDKTTGLPLSSSLPQLDDLTKSRILALIKELGQSNISSSHTDTSSTIKLAFVDKNLYICSTCSGPVQWV